MDFDPRAIDDSRDRDVYGRELNQGSRGGLSNPRERERLDPRDVFTRDRAIQTIAKRGFTDRQARFLVLVARHSGVCVMRQYSTFAGIVFGQKTRKFFADLVRARFVSTYDCAHIDQASTSE